MENDQSNKPGNQSSSTGRQGNIGSAGSEGTEAFNNGNEGKSGADRGNEESGNFDQSGSGNYEGGNLGTAGSGGKDLKTPGTGGESLGYDRNNHLTNSSNDEEKVPVPIVKDNYEGGNMGSAGSGGMEMHGSESSLSLDALNPEKSDDSSGNSNPESRNPHGLGSPPPPDIADGGDGGAKQPKEHTGQDTEMGGATGGTEGLGNGNNATGLEGQGEGNKDGSGSGSGGGGSSAGSNG